MFVKRQYITPDDQFADEIIMKHGGTVSIAVDFDDTVALIEKDEANWRSMKPNKYCFETLNKWKDMGCAVYMDTRRSETDRQRALAWCANCKFEFNGVIGGKRSEDPPAGYQTVFRVDDRSLGTPLLYDKNEVYRDHVDWKAINDTMTVMLQTLTERIKERKKYIKSHEEEICFY